MPPVSFVVAPAPEAWPDQVNGAVLLEEIATFFEKYLVLPDGAAYALTAWTLHTYAHDLATTSPILAIVSPDKRCGKTTLLTILAEVVYRPLLASNLSASSLFRLIERERPTCLIDEADTFLHGNEFRGLLNSGHSRSAARFIRSAFDGKDWQPRAFSTWAPKAVACIGSLPPTVMDRSIVIPMRRRGRGERRPQFSLLTEGPYLAELRRKSLRWVADNSAEIQTAQPNLPSSLNDRAADNWRPLAAISSVAGEASLRRVLEATAVLSDDDEDAGATALLEDLRRVFEERSIRRVSTAVLLDDLIAMEDRPWGDLEGNGRPITSQAIAKLLRPFGIRPRKFREGSRTPWGYVRDRVVDEAFERYLEPYTKRPEHSELEEQNDVSVPEVPDVPDTLPRPSNTDSE